MRKFFRNLTLLLLFSTCVHTVSFAWEDPVIWIYVKTKINFNNSVSVDWGVMAEPADHWYEIERSDNGRTFRVIASVHGRGSNLGDNHYRQLDSTVRNRVTYYYRVSLIGPDGIPRYSPIVPVTLAKNEDRHLVRLHPNPAPQTLFVKINKERARSGQITISDIAGVTRFSCGVEKWGDQDTPLSIQVGTWPRGMYVLSIITADGDRQVSPFFVKH